MTITLNHTIVPARDKAASAKFFAGIFGLKCGRAGYFAPVKVNKSLTLLFDEDEQVRKPSSGVSRQQQGIRRHSRARQKTEHRHRQRAVEPARRQAQPLERRPRILFRGHQRPCARAHDRNDAQ
jgi:catechol 2,3-dioxygenase-like lactoylglutathione lyase family enzyme